jgi:hypothetical protein
MKLLPRTQFALKSRSFMTHIDFGKTSSIISEYFEFLIGVGVNDNTKKSTQNIEILKIGRGVE